MATLSPTAEIATDTATQAAVGRMPLGPDDLVTVAKPAQVVSPGITYEKYIQGQATDTWSVELLITGSSWSVGTRDYADRLGRQAGGQGVHGAGGHSGASGGTGCGAGLLRQHMVQVDPFGPDQPAQADELLRPLQAAVFTERTVYTAQVGNRSTGPWEVRVVRIDLGRPHVQGCPRKRHPSAQTVRELGAAAGALVAVNGSDFDIDSPNNPSFAGFDGDPQGLYVQGNSLISKANNGRTALLLEGAGSRVRVDEVSSRTQVTAHDGAVRAIDGSTA
ncbi:hypothetical protein [Streptomyces sp. NPDC053431]|uniref:hypothetical protein n=1 Tax=Streptomyces sp. NPDC053431 TaxID=3365703 RepID=UPI0037D01432